MTRRALKDRGGFPEIDMTSSSFEHSCSRPQAAIRGWSNILELLL